MKLSKLALQELELLGQGVSILHPRAVVDRARDIDNPLHPYFEWDDDKAAEKYRIDQAREVLRVAVKLLPNGSGKPIRAFVSLMSDRMGEGGYRPITTILSDEGLYAQMLNDALEELKYFREKYKRIGELKPVFDAINQVKTKRGRKKKEIPVSV